MRGNSWHITVSIKRLYLFRNVKPDQTENAVTTVNVKAAYELESPGRLSSSLYSGAPSSSDPPCWSG